MVPSFSTVPPALSTPPPACRAPVFTQETFANDERRFCDGFDSSRDITRVEADEGRPDEPYRFRVMLNNLKPGAENGHLDLYWLIGTRASGGTTSLPDAIPGATTHPWNLCVGAYDERFHAVVDASGKRHDEALKWARFDAPRRVVEVALDKTALRDSGWHDGQPLTLQAFTARDHDPIIADSLDAPGRKPWQNGGVLDTAVTSGEAIANPVSTCPARRSPEWDGESIYFILTDRFKDGDKKNDYGVDADLRHYHGGDLRGIIDKLDYIKDLGMTTLWVSPPMANQTRHGNYDGFHGYWPVDFYTVDARQGDMATFKTLVAQAHARGMKVVMDLPLNQTAWEHPWTRDPTKSDWYHHEGDIKDWNDPHQLECGNVLGLPDLAQENPRVAKELINIAKFWIDETGIDGFRLDAVKHVHFPFWPTLAKDIHEHAGPDFLLLGEDVRGDLEHVARYQNSAGIEGMLDYPLYYAVLDSIGRGASMRGLAQRLRDEALTFDNSRMLSLFIDNHDMNRFWSVAAPFGDARGRLECALAFMFTIDRIPNVYMGDEVGMDGTTETDNPAHMPYNRKDMEFERDPALLGYFKSLAHLRADTPALREGGYLEAWQDDHVLAYERPARNGTAFIVLNNGVEVQHRDIPAPAAGNLKNGMRLRDALSGEEVVVQEGRIAVDIPAHGARILLPA